MRALNQVYKMLESPIPEMPENPKCQKTRYSIETKKRKKPDPEVEEVPENGYDVSAFFDTKCRQGEREPDDEPVEESIKELLFFDFECRQENGNHEPNLCTVQNEAGDEWIFHGNNTRDEFCEWLFTSQLYSHGP